MFLLDPGTVVYSASDLTTAAACEWAFMRRLDAKLGRVGATPEAEDAMLARTAGLGDAHELRMLQRLRSTRQVVEIERPAFGEIASAVQLSEDALRSGAEVVFQAAFFDGRFLGYADFIIRSGEAGEGAGAGGAYEVYDTKLARKAKITALLQLAAYGDQLQRMGIPTGEHVHLLLGDGHTSTHRLRDILPVYRKRRARLERLIDERVADQAPTEWGDPRYAACGRCAACEKEVQDHRDVLLVANLRLTQRARLRAAGVSTIEELAAASGPVPGISDSSLGTLRQQAKLQVGSPPGVPSWLVINPAALAALPEPDAGDIFFDFEGDPLYQEGDGGTGRVAWGLDYLFGLVEQGDTFRAFWAHNHAEERRALIDFLEYVRERRERHPGLHIYHYAPYERTHLLTLAARHGVGEDAVDDLLRNHVLVDLYPVVRQGLRIGSRSYSLKKLEPLYMGDEERAGVKNAADSIAEYVRYSALAEAGETDAAAEVLGDIARYNAYDCRSTLRLRDWLLTRAAENAVPPATATELALDVPLREPDPVYLELEALLEHVPPAERTPDQTALALASAAIDYHRREQKSFWWDHFDRLRSPVDDWADTRDVLIIDIDTIEVERDWGIEGRDRSQSRTLRFTGTAAPGSAFRTGHKPYLVYDPPYPPIEENTEPGARFAHARAEIIDEEDGVYLLREKLRKDAPAYDQLPMALTPAAPPAAGSQIEAISQWGRALLDAWPEPLPDPAFDILRRQPPRRGLDRGSSLSRPGLDDLDHRPDDVRVAIRDDLLALDHSYLAVQGPPGTGKTYTGSHVIVDLVMNHGWKVGVVAQSHAAVENMLHAVVKAGAEAGLDPARVGKKPKDGDVRRHPWTALDTKSFGGFTGQSGGYVVGGTAWDFSNDGRVPRGSLDLLVIDEAGQFSLASTIAAAVSAQRLLLLGDPQQLPQVSQGTHPEPVDVSALGWLSDGHNVLPGEFGYFLATSWRMHPAVCAPVSALSYEGKLHSHLSDRRLDGVAPGLHPVPVRHTANSTSSIEEADAVVALVAGVLGRPWTAHGETRPLAQDNLIVVAPYNAQVELIRARLLAAGLDAVPVGTVDKFQGREAAVAIVSLAASSAEEVPRGLEFLLMANRLNVAISRAQWAAYLVYSPALTEYLPTSVETLAQLSAFITLVDARPDGESGGYSASLMAPA